METIVVTGSTKGIGLGLAKEFLRLGCRLVINGRNETLVREQVETLKLEFGSDKVLGVAGDVTNYNDVQKIWDSGVQCFGKIDIWINNAGIMNSHTHTWEQSPEELKQIVDINLIGSMYGCKVAIQGMMTSGGGNIYNFEGFGSNGRQFHPFMTPYGATKSAIRYLTKSLAKEALGTGVKIGAIAPGIVVTDLLKEPYRDKPNEWEKAKKIFNILGDRVETVTPYLAAQVLKNPKNGGRIDWLTFGKVLSRFLSSLFVKRNVISTQELTQN